MNEVLEVPPKMDGRRVKSRKKLKVALAKLLQNKSIEKITIEELAKAANVTRPTFYSNFNGVQDIVIEYIDELMLAFIDEYKKIDVDLSISPQERVAAGIMVYMKLLQQNNGILLSAASGRAGNEALELIRVYNMRILMIRAEKVPDSGLSDQDLQLSSFFFSGAINTVLEAHASGKLKVEAEFLANSIATLMHQGLGQELGDPDGNSAD